MAWAFGFLETASPGVSAYSGPDQIGSTRRVFTAASQFAPGRSAGSLLGPQVLICDIPSLTLTPGEYSLCVSLEIDNAEADLVNDAARLVMIESDYYGTGRVPWNGTFVLKHRWYMEKPVSTS